jgi:hypothetical protein
VDSHERVVGFQQVPNTPSGCRGRR